MLAGMIIRALLALTGGGAGQLAVYLVISCALGAVTLFLSAELCKRTFSAGGTSAWWRARIHAFWDRRIRKAAVSATSCFLALALAFSLGAFPLPAIAAGTEEEPAVAPAEADIYTPPEDVQLPEDAAEEDPALDPEGAQGSENGAEEPAEAETEEEEKAQEPEIPALPPEDYYEQPDIEGTPIAISGEETLLKVSEKHYTTVIGGADVAYEDPSGNVREIDNELVAVSEGLFEEPSLYRNRANAFTAELPASEEASVAGLVLDASGYQVSLIPRDVDFSRACAEGEAVRYTEARPGIDWQYTLVGSVVKEDIVLAHPVDAQAFDTTLALSSGLDARMEEGVCVIFHPTSEGDQEIMRIAAPIALDAAGDVNDNLTLSLDWKDGERVLTLAPDWDWLSSPERAYPVRIDPTVDIAPTAVRVGCVEQQWRNLVIGENGYSFAGYDDGVTTGTGAYNHGLGHAICRAYAQTNYDFSFIMSEARIDSATFSLYQATRFSKGATNFGLYRVMEPWDFDKLTWANQESLTHELICFRQANASAGYIDWDVRECVNNWVQGVWEQRGFCVKAEYERGMQCEMFQNRYAANPPRLTVNWTIPDPVDESRALDDITVNLRTLTEHDADNKLLFDGVFADGEATPRSTVAYTLDPAGEAGLAYASRSYKYPDSSEWQASIPNATRYKDKLSNWQSHVFADLAFDTLYKVRALAMKDGASGREATSDSFLIYKASAKDTLPYIASHYGVTLDQLARDNRVQDCLVVGGNTIFVRNPKTTVAYNPANLTEDQKRRIDSGLMGRGKHCEYGFEPVNMNTGNFVLEGIDAQAPDLDGDFEIRRTYNSKASAESGALGRGWSLSFTDRLSAEASGALIYTASDGASYWFDPDGEGGYVLDGDAGFELERIAYRPDGAAADAPDLYRYEITDADGRLFAFDCFGMLTSITSASGLVTQVSYGADHMMSKVTSPSGRAYSFEHDSMGRVSAVVLPDGNRVTYGYDAKGNLTSVTEAGGGSIQYLYDANSLMTEWRDPSGAPMVRNAYDAQGRVTAQFDANGARSVIAYSDGMTVATDAVGNTTTYRFDDLYRTTSVTYPDGYTVNRAYDARGNVIADEEGTYSYDANGHLASETDLRGMTTTYLNDEAGHILQMTRPDGETISYTYDAAGNCVSEASSTGRAFTRTYDELNRMTSETDADGVTTTIGWSGADKASETDPLGNTTTYAYDAMGRCISVTDASGATSRTSYDAMGRMVAETDGAGGSTRFALDARGLLVSLVDQNGATTTFSYDAAANLISMTDAKGSTWTYAYDAVGDRVSETDPLGNTTHMTYDSCGRMASKADAEGVTEAWEYDGRGRIIAHTLPTGATETFAYEGALEEPASETDALGNTTTRAFTATGEVTSITYPDGTIESFSYLGDEVVSHASAGGLTTTMALTSAGRVSSVDMSGRTWSYAYDAAGRMVSGTDPLG